MCGRCGYEAEVCGGHSEGLVMQVETIACLVCRELYDVVVGERPLMWTPAAGTAEEGCIVGDDCDADDDCNEDRYGCGVDPTGWGLGLGPLGALTTTAADNGFRAVRPRCPRCDEHSWRRWTDPGPCPRCGEILDRSEDVLLHWD